VCNDWASESMLSPFESSSRHTTPTVCDLFLEHDQRGILHRFANITRSLRTNLDGRLKIQGGA
jgi:hypothetical protein